MGVKTRQNQNSVYSQVRIERQTCNSLDLHVFPLSNNNIPLGVPKSGLCLDMKLEFVNNWVNIKDLYKYVLPPRHAKIPLGKASDIMRQ